MKQDESQTSTVPTDILNMGLTSKGWVQNNLYNAKLEISSEGKMKISSPVLPLCRKVNLRTSDLGNGALLLQVLMHRRNSRMLSPQVECY